MNLLRRKKQARARSGVDTHGVSHFHRGCERPAETADSPEASHDSAEIIRDKTVG
jgi:hypothetical protein